MTTVEYLTEMCFTLHHFLNRTRDKVISNHTFINVFADKQKLSNATEVTLIEKNMV